MIPKIIHYCWLSTETIPEKIQKCIDSWSKYLPEYHIKLWNHEKFPRGRSKWVDQAFDHKKYAFAADYIRCYALYHEGGIYLDSDVEVIKSFNELLTLPYFISLDSAGFLESAVMGFEKGNPIFKEALHYYDTNNFVTNGKMNLKTMPLVLQDSVKINKEIKVFDKPITEWWEDEEIFCVLTNNYFSPKSYLTGEIDRDAHTYTVHHFAGSWQPKWKLKIKELVILFGGYPLKNFIKKIFHKKKNN